MKTPDEIYNDLLNSVYSEQKEKILKDKNHAREQAIRHISRYIEKNLYFVNKKSTFLQKRTFLQFNYDTDHTWAFDERKEARYYLKRVLEEHPDCIPDILSYFKSAGYTIILEKWPLFNNGFIFVDDDLSWKHRIYKFLLGNHYLTYAAIGLVACISAIATKNLPDLTLNTISLSIAALTGILFLIRTIIIINDKIPES